LIFIEVILKINYYKSIMVYDLRVFMGWEEILMSSVTKRISMVKQPYGGYLNKNQFDVSVIDDGKILNEKENISPSLIGLAVDYLTRFMMGASAKDAFKISLLGASCLDLFLNNASGKKGIALKNAEKLLKGVKGLDDKSVSNACKLVGYDVCFRASIMGYRPVEEINPDSDTIENIVIMVNRGLKFWKEYGPIIKDGFTFEGGYTDIVTAGDGDYLTKETLWDFKVSKDELKSKYTLQLLMYYIMGCHSIHSEFKEIQKLGIFNPRKNKVYIANISLIDSEILDEVSREVIGYK
jgi:hypothetical protein